MGNIISINAMLIVLIGAFVSIMAVNLVALVWRIILNIYIKARKF